MKHLVAGVAFVGLGLWGMVSWWSTFGLVMRGMVPFALLGIGLVAALSGYRRLSQRAEPAEPDDDSDRDEEPVRARNASR